jgi:predicted RecB family endonuclease
VRAWRERWAGRARQLRGARGERRAERILETHGYAIRARQARLDYAIEVDGSERVMTIVADFIVERGGERLVAEVKTGDLAPRVERAETRRQLLEYQLASGARSVLLVDPDARAISEIAFPLAGSARRSSPAGLRAALALVMVALLAAWYAKR